MTPETHVRMENTTAKALGEFAEARGLNSRGDAAAKLLEENRAIFNAISEEIDNDTLGNGITRMLDTMIMDRIKERHGASSPDIVAALISSGINCDVSKINDIVEQRLDALCDDDKIITIFKVGTGAYWGIPSECDLIKKKKK